MGFNLINPLPNTSTITTCFKPLDKRKQIDDANLMGKLHSSHVSCYIIRQDVLAFKLLSDIAVDGDGGVYDTPAQPTPSRPLKILSQNHRCIETLPSPTKGLYLKHLMDGHTKFEVCKRKYLL